MDEGTKTPGDFVDWNRLRVEKDFQIAFLTILTEWICLKKYPDFMERSRSRFRRMGFPNFKHDDVDKEQKEFEKKMKRMQTLEQFRQFCSENGIDFPTEEEIHGLEEKALDLYSITQNSDQSDDLGKLKNEPI